MSCGVENFIHQWFSIRVFVSKNVPGDLDQIAVQFAFIPALEYLVNGGSGHTERFFHNLIRFADELHIAVLDAVMYHFYIVAGSVFADPIAARSSIFYFCGNRLENRFYMRPGGRRTARHKRRTFQRTFFAARHTCSDVEKPSGFDVLGSAYGIRKMGISSVYDDIAG